MDRSANSVPALRWLSARYSVSWKVVVVDSRNSRKSRRTRRALVALAGITLVGGCSSSSTTKASSTTAATPTSNAPTASVSGTTNPTQTSTTLKSAADTSHPVGTGRGFSDPCGLTTLNDVQAVLPGAPEGKATLASATFASCEYVIDPEHRVIISLATGPADTMATTKAAVAGLSGLTKIDGLGDVGYSSSRQTRLDVHFFKGDTEVLMSAYGQPGGVDSLVALAKKVSAAL